ncbi:hypothetical protein PIB30_101857 [Stylosanthes scabra]|uniref:Uncharacterized protein n=1 Tax=Stylosanthes scabra TaxID=79078 RepID=A0ABU6ZW51_9FABA|nr:hypothetical protein [Stylosanthes scabra]
MSSPAIAEQCHLLRVAVISKLCSTAAITRSLHRGHRWCSRMSPELKEPRWFMAIPAASAKVGCCCLGLIAGVTVVGFPYDVVLLRLRVCLCSCCKGCGLILANFDKLR